ncbi:MAG: fibronectin type III domain-containing protein [Flavobacteriales bacterium]|nr:fibronectin type III domain-containing protein [Flavobacteriales bacterium]MCB9194145.1 fibronectin type III domain-containing protein [Flavobacteriales bacterium]
MHIRSIPRSIRDLNLILLGILPLSILAQTGPTGQVAARILAREASGAAFGPVALFTPSSPTSTSITRDALVHVVVERAAIMDLDTVATMGLLTSRPERIRLSVPTPDGGIDLLLQQADIFQDGFSVVVASTGAAAAMDRGLHYRGIIAGRPNSLVAISIFRNEVMGFVSDRDGNHILGRIKGHHGQHIYYAEQDMIDPPVMTCATPEDAGTYDPQMLELQGSNRTANCVGIYWEVNYDVYQDKGSLVNTSNYVTGLFNQSATIYDNDGISVQLAQLYVWDMTSPYTATSTSALLGQFQSYRNSFTGDLGNLLGYAGGGGIAAGFSGLCASNLDNSQCYSGISGSYNVVPTYSWSAMVVTHEQGHLLGSRHTHACVWNGNNTAIDGCGPAHGYGYEGSCSGAPIPSSGGTIMSYCHLDAVGINFNNGFGPQPTALIINDINAASCLSACVVGCGVPDFLSATFIADVSATVNWGTVIGALSYNLQWKPSNSGTWNSVTGISGSSYGLTGLTVGVTYDYRVQTVCTGATSAYSATAQFTTQACTQVLLDLVLDEWGSETTWSITSPGGGTTYASGGPYDDQSSAGEYAQPTIPICLPDGCYELQVNDSYGDGMWSGSGNGHYTLTTAGGTVLARGGNMVHQTITTFCLPHACTSTLPYSESFDNDLGGWLLDAANVDLQWLQYDAPTPSTSTGPDADHTSGSGQYLYCEASSPNYPSKTAILTSPCFDLSSYTNVSMTFWRHMYGADMGTLSVDVQMNDGPWTNGIWTLSGDQGNNWVQATVDLTPYLSANTRVRFRGITGNNYASDMAIDDVALTGTSGVKLDAKLWLEGPYNTGTLLMDDGARAAGLLPTAEPYSAMGYTNAGGGGGETTTTGVLGVTGSNAIVDWVRLELRSSSDPTTVLATRQCLVQRDGDVVDVDGTSPVTFYVAAGNYYVVARHRNHLGCMTAATRALSAVPTTVDFRSSGTATYGTNARKNVSGAMLLWAGDATSNGQIKYAGSGNDRDAILTRIGGSVPTNVTNGYYPEDVNLNGQVKYAGAQNDRDPILVNIGGTVPTAVRTEQLP